MSGLTLNEVVLPLVSPIMDRVHQRTLQHFVGQNLVNHLELEGGGDEVGRLRVAIAFADPAGYTRFTVEAAGPHLEFDPIGEVRLKGFSETTELILARARP